MDSWLVPIQLTPWQSSSEYRAPRYDVRKMLVGVESRTKASSVASICDLLAWLHIDPARKKSNFLPKTEESKLALKSTLVA